VYQIVDTTPYPEWHRQPIVTVRLRRVALLGDSLVFAVRFARPIVMAGTRRAVAQHHDCDRRGSLRHRRITGGARRSVAQAVELDALDVRL
jgi:hypothetical protein